ncbi:MAG: ABC transporter ATP-binding protein [Spirochaetia bacterium]
MNGPHRTASVIHLVDVDKSFGRLRVLDSLSMDIFEDKVTVILGPSGCGKTTLLNIISGTDRDYTGDIRGLDDKVISYLFQEPRLLPWKTVRGNLEFVLKGAVPEEGKHALIDRHLEMVELSDFGGYYPDQLSGGMKQRVAVARAFAYPSEILLMDEPFQALDLALKLNLLDAFLKLWENSRRTALFVTHDIQEAILLGERIYVLSDRPAKPLACISLDVPHRERSLDDPRLLRIEQDLYRLLTGA